MVSEGNGWWKYFIVGDSCTILIFNNHVSLQTANLSHCGDGWYYGSTNTWVNNPLPLKLVCFSGFEKNGEVVLNCFTTDAVAEKRYVIERSENGSFVDIGFVTAKNSFGNTVYSYSDKVMAYSGKLQYRLKMISLDGSYSYSNIIELNTSTSNTVSIYPNPAKGKFYLSFGKDIHSTYTLTLMDITRKMITSKQIEVASGGSNSIVIPESLTGGMYLLKLVDEKTHAVIISKVEIAN